MDMSGGIEKNGSYEENVLSSNVGYDHVFKLGNERLVLGAAGTVTQVNKKDVGSKDEGLMYSLSGYLSFEQKEGFELQSYLTAGYLMNDRTFIPEISLGEQKFDEKSWVLMSSNCSWQVGFFMFGIVNFFKIFLFDGLFALNKPLLWRHL